MLASISRRMLICLSVVFLYAGCGGGSFLNLGGNKTLVSDQEEFTRQIEVAPNVKTLEIHHHGGNISVVGWDKPYILLEGVTRASGETAELARQTLDMVQVIAYERAINRLVIDYQCPSGFANGKIPEEGVDYTANVPRKMLVDIQSEIGSVEVSNMDSDISIQHEKGDVNCETINGSATITASGIKNAGNTLRVHQLQGSMILNAKYLDTTVDQVGGELEITHQTGGLSVSNITRKLTVRGTNTAMTLNQIKGFIQLHNKNGDVVCSDFHDGILMDITGGTLKLEPHVPVLQNYECSIEKGDLILRVPENSSMLLEITAMDGSIRSEFPLPVSAEGKVSYARGAIGSGYPVVRLKATQGAISVIKDYAGSPNIAPVNPVSSPSPAPTRETTTVPAPQPTISGSDLQ